MSLVFQSIFTNKNPTFSLVPLSSTRFLKPPNSTFSHPDSRARFPNYTLWTSHHYHILPLKRINSSSDGFYSTSQSLDDSSITTFNFDSILSILEFLTLASSAAISSFVAISFGASKGGLSGWLGGRIFVWQCVFLVAGVSIGALIRRRQWRRASGSGFSRGYGANLSGRVEKLEEDLRSSATLIRVLSRQLEKLGIRVKATRKALKEPISQTAALAQKNSEATRALAVQEDILEKELVEIQKVLLAMQEQQQKQLELILAIGTAGKLWDTGHIPSKDPNASMDDELSSEINQNETLGVASASQQ